jgi:acyl-CoA hydrolase
MKQEEMDLQSKPQTQSEFNIELLKKGELVCRNSQFCKGKQVGVHGRMFGADMMEELDAVCAVFSAEICDTPWIVTKTMNIEFKAPILPNQIYKTYVGIEKIGRTSISLNTEIRKHSVQTERETVAVSCKAVFVRINEEGESIPISDHIRKKFGFDSVI